MTEIKKEENSLIPFRLILTLSVCLLVFSPCMMWVQCIGKCAVHQGRFHTSRGYHDEYIGGYHEYIGRCSVHQGDTMSTSGDIMSTSEVFGTLGFSIEIKNLL